MPLENPIAAGGNERVAVLMAVFNGARFLPEQIDSIANQTAPQIDLWFSDDGSSDGTDMLLANTIATWRKGHAVLLRGPRRGFAENFRFLTTREDIDADYVAYCDQDDIWDADKLSVAVEWLSGHADVPALYCSRTRLISADGKPLGRSPLFPKPPAFNNALVQSIAGGNTLVFNRRAHHVIREASQRTSFVTHDWWTYQVISGSGGVVHYSETPRVSYRQHAANLIGSNNTWSARMLRFRSLLRGRFQDWNDRNIAALSACDDLLTPEAVATLHKFEHARRGSLVARLTALREGGVYRQTLLGQIGLYVACALGRL